MSSPTLLSDLLQGARQQLQQQAPGSAQDAAVLSRLQALHPAAAVQAVGGNGQLALRRAAWGGSWLAGSALMLALALLLIEPPGLGPVGAGRHAGREPVDTGFMPVVSAAEWQRALGSLRSDGQAAVLLMPAELPRERLALMGLPYDPGRAAEPVRAELMLNPDGQLLAVRFLE